MSLIQSRKQKDTFFKTDGHSPLTPEQQSSFNGLSYFDENPALEFALEIEKLEALESIEVQTSTGDVREYTRYGKVHFEVEGQEASLTLYDTPNGFFVPFTDSQAGKETYGAGRYLDPEVLPDGRVVIDFNLAYNPYCAYNDQYSCPLTPFENRLKVAIQAGEKNYQ